MGEFLFNVAAWLSTAGAVFWLLERLERVIPTLRGQGDRERAYLERHASEASR